MNTDSAIKILSVDPGKTPVGALNPEMTLRFMRRRGIAQSVMTKRNARTAEMVFATNSSRKRSFNLLAFRMLAGVSMLVFGLLSLTGIVSIGINLFASLLFIGSSVMIVSGAFSRILGIVGFITCAMILTAASGSAVIVAGVTAAVFGTLAIAGPGRFSLDRRFQRNLRDRLIRNESSSLDDYRAFSRL